MSRFRLLFAVDLLILAFVAWQGSVIATSSLTMTTPQGATTVIPMDRWPMVAPTLSAMAFLAAVLAGAAMLQRRGRTGLALLLLLVPAVPTVLGGLLIGGLMLLFTLGTPGH